VKKIFGALFLLQWRKKAVGGRQKKVPDLFFYILGTQQILGGQSYATENWATFSSRRGAQS